MGPATIHDGEPPVDEERSWAGAWNRMTRRELLVGCVTARTICLHAIILHKDGMALSLTHNRVLHQALARPLHERKGQFVVEDTTPGPVIPYAPSSLKTESCAYGHPTAPSVRPGVCGRAMYRGGEPRSKDGKEGTETATGSRAETGMSPERGGHGNGADTGTGVETRGLTQHGNGDGIGDGNGGSNGDGNGNGNGNENRDGRKGGARGDTTLESATSGKKKRRRPYTAISHAGSSL